MPTLVALLPANTHLFHTSYTPACYLPACPSHMVFVVLHTPPPSPILLPGYYYLHCLPILHFFLSFIPHTHSPPYAPLLHSSPCTLPSPFPLTLPPPRNLYTRLMCEFPLCPLGCWIHHVATHTPTTPCLPHTPILHTTQPLWLSPHGPHTHTTTSSTTTPHPPHLPYTTCPTFCWIACHPLPFTLPLPIPPYPLVVLLTFIPLPIPLPGWGRDGWWEGGSLTCLPACHLPITYLPLPFTLPFLLPPSLPAGPLPACPSHLPLACSLALPVPVLPGLGEFPCPSLLGVYTLFIPADSQTFALYLVPTHLYTPGIVPTHGPSHLGGLLPHTLHNLEDALTIPHPTPPLVCPFPLPFGRDICALCLWDGDVLLPPSPCTPPTTPLPSCRACLPCLPLPPVHSPTVPFHPYHHTTLPPTLPQILPDRFLYHHTHLLTIHTGSLPQLPHLPTCWEFFLPSCPGSLLPFPCLCLPSPTPHGTFYTTTHSVAVPHHTTLPLPPVPWSSGWDTDFYICILPDCLPTTNPHTFPAFPATCACHLPHMFCLPIWRGEEFVPLALCHTHLPYLHLPTHDK